MRSWSSGRSFAATMNRHGCMLLADGAHRAASRMLLNFSGSIRRSGKRPRTLPERSREDEAGIAGLRQSRLKRCFHQHQFSLVYPCRINYFQSIIFKFKAIRQKKSKLFLQRHAEFLQQAPKAGSALPRSALRQSSSRIAHVWRRCRGRAFLLSTSAGR